MKPNSQKAPLTSARLKEVLDCDPQKGSLKWKLGGARPHRWAGCEAGGHTLKGYRRIKVDGSTYQRSRLVWLAHTGSFPELLLDHVNGVRDDDRIENLRQCSNAENVQNLGLTRTNKSGVMGVSWKAKNQRWCAQIKHAGVVRHLGLFDSLESAAAARADAKRKYHTFNPVDANRLAVQR